MRMLGKYGSGDGEGNNRSGGGGERNGEELLHMESFEVDEKR